MNTLRNARRLVLGSGLLLPAMMVMAIAASAPAAADGLVKVELLDKADGSQAMTLDMNEVKAGKVTFNVTNVSTTKEHEFLFVKTDLAPDQLPLNADGLRIDESKLAGVEELGDLAEGESGTIAADLTPGNYVLFCNLKGHYDAGMFTTLTVTP
jgi:uncharacterized cupredoxin-like copper-binding protein